MKIRYDPDADAMYIRLTDEEIDKTRKIDDNTILDYDKNGQLVGIEILFVKERIPEFLEEVKDMKHKNLAFETLKKLLHDEIKARFKTNKVKSKKFSQMLEETIRRYQNRSIDSAQIIQELIEIAKEVRQAQEEGKDLGLSEDEIAFYDALDDHDGATDILGEDVIKKG